MEYKILLTGPVGAGKTTAVNSLSCIEVVNTDVDASDITLNRKPTTTVAMDYGVYRAEGQRIHLYGSPGQERFDFMWDILTLGTHGVVLLVDNSRDNPLQDMKHYLKLFDYFVAERKLVIGVTCRDISETPAINDYCNELAAMNLDIPVYAVDPRNGKDVLGVVHALIEPAEEIALRKQAV